MQVQELKKNAVQMLRRGNYSVRKLTAIHAGALVGISLLTPVLSLLLENYGGSGGGLDGLGSYALVATAQVVLMLAVVLAELFWCVGYQNAALEYVNGQNVTPGSLLAGFRRWGAVLVSTLLVAFLLVGRGFIAMFISSQIVALLPVAEPLNQAVEQLMVDPTADMMALLGDSVYALAAVFAVIYVVLYALLALPMHYRYRMVNYILMKEQKVGGLRALLFSHSLTYHRRMELFKIDLHFWWYYALSFLISCLGSGAMILSLMGVALPVSVEAAEWGFMLLALAAQFGLFLWAKPVMEATWAQAFEQLMADQKRVQEEAEVPKRKLSDFL